MSDDPDVCAQCRPKTAAATEAGSTTSNKKRHEYPDGAFITGGDSLMDGGVTASYFFGELAPA